MALKTDSATQIQHREDFFQTKDGFKLYRRWWLPASEAKAVIAIAHGYAEHCSRYNYVATAFAKAGYAVGSFDFRGHGKSSGKRAYINAFEDYLLDLDHFMEEIPKFGSEKPIFLLGHSVGGLIASMYVVTRQPKLSGLLLSGAALKVQEDLSPFLQKISGFVSKIAPKLPTVKLDGGSVSRDPKEVEKYDNDPLIYRGGTLARTGAELLRATKQIQEKMETITLPLLIMHGSIDRLTDPNGSRQLHERSASADKTLKIYDGLYHEILNEPEKDEIIAEILAWLAAR